MKNKLIYSMLAIVFTLGLFSCKEVTSNLPIMQKLEDSIANKFRCGDTKVEIDEYSYLHITFNDAVLNNKPTADKQKIADEIGNIVVSLFTGSQKLDKGNVIFTNTKKTEASTNNKDSGYDMHLEALMKAMKK